MFIPWRLYTFSRGCNLIHLRKKGKKKRRPNTVDNFRDSSPLLGRRALLQTRTNYRNQIVMTKLNKE